MGERQLLILSLIHIYAAIRPFLLTSEEAEKAPAAMKTTDAKALKTETPYKLSLIHI